MLERDDPARSQTGPLRHDKLLSPAWNPGDHLGHLAVADRQGRRYLQAAPTYGTGDDASLTTG